MLLAEKTVLQAVTGCRYGAETRRRTWRISWLPNFSANTYIKNYLNRVYSKMRSGAYI